MKGIFSDREMFLENLGGERKLRLKAGKSQIAILVEVKNVLIWIIHA